MVWAGHDVVVLEVSEPRVCSQQMSSSGSTPHSCRHLPALALVGGCQEPKHLSNRKTKHLWFWIWMGFSWHQWANAGCPVGIQRQEWHAEGIEMQAGHIPAGISLPTLEGNSWVKVESWDLELISWGALSSKSTTVWACEYKFTGASGWHLTNSSLLEGNERSKLLPLLVPSPGTGALFPTEIFPELLCTLATLFLAKRHAYLWLKITSQPSFSSLNATGLSVFPWETWS